MSELNFTLREIQESANIPELIKQIEQSGNKTPLALIPKSMAVHSLEKYMPEASRLRMHFSTESIEDFTAYCKKFDKEGASCFIDGNTMSAKTFLDLGTEENPLHQDHSASMGLEKSAAYIALLQACSRELNQKAMVEFLEDWSDQVVMVGFGSEVMLMSAAIAALRDMTIDSVKSSTSEIQDFSENMTSSEKIEARNQNKLPIAFIFKTVTFLGLKEREFHVRIGILTAYERPTLSIRILQHEKLKDEMVSEFKEVLVKGFSKLKIDTFIGRA